MKINELNKLDLGIIPMWYYDTMSNVLMADDNMDLAVNFNLELPISINNDELVGEDIISHPEDYSKITITDTNITKVFLHQDEDSEEYGQAKLNGELFQMLQIFYNLFRCIPSYRILDKYDYYCNGPAMTHIEIDCNELTIEEINQFICKINNTIFEDIHHFTFKNLSSISDDWKYEIIGTNTKTRRLGYLKFIIELFNKSKYYPLSYFSKLIERESQKLNNELELYIDTKGLIKETKTGNSAKPYIDLLNRLSLVTVINNSFILTKQAKVYFAINNLNIRKEIVTSEKQLNIFHKVEKSVFNLNLFDKIYFLNQILTHDALYFCSLLDIIRIINTPTDSKEIKIHYKRYILKELLRNRKYNDFKTKEIINRINDWKNEMIYLEHIIEPRLNWMLDLGLISIAQTEKRGKYYTLSISGKLFHNILETYYNRTELKTKSINELLKENLFKIATHVYKLNKEEVSSLSNDLIEEHLNKAFKLFKTDAPNRISLSTAIYYICYIYYFKYDKIVEYNQLKNQLLNTKSNYFGIDWFSSENDGSIFLKK